MDKAVLEAPAAIKYESLCDEELINLIRLGDGGCQDFLIGKYKNLVKVKARTYFLMGADRDDIIQEGMIGLFKAIRDYESGKNTAFYSFADLCISRQIFTAIKAATRKKHSPLNGYISLNHHTKDDEKARTIGDITQKFGKTLDPESILIEKEDREYIEKKMNESLSSMETEVLGHYLSGKSYSDISVSTNKSVKSIDNTLQRIKRKVEKHMREKRLD